MRQSQLFSKTSKQAPKDEVSNNAILLIRAGFVYKEMAGVYSYLPLGFRVLQKIQDIIRKNLDAAGCQEMVMTALQPKARFEATDRWSDEKIDNWFKTTLKNGTELGLAFTHEEAITEIAASFVSSYKDLPFCAYQFQTKFRNELRAKSGIMRGREFIMKDLYSFHTNKEEHDKFYEKMKEVYTNIFNDLGIGKQTYLTMSNGFPFSKYSFEFQTLTEAGEDILLYDEEKKLAINKEDYSEEIFTDFGYNKADFNFKEASSSEVGDIYTLGTKYSEALGLEYTDKEGKKHPVFAGSYGIGVPRVMGTIVEVHHDEKGVIWPESVAPYKVHLVSLCREESDINKAEDLYKKLLDAGIEVLYDDRQGIQAGQKFGDSDLIGIPNRVIISPKTLADEKVELVDRSSGNQAFILLDSTVAKFV